MYLCCSRRSSWAWSPSRPTPPATATTTRRSGGAGNGPGPGRRYPRPLSGPLGRPRTPRHS
jgi:hypothetical protein